MRCCWASEHVLSHWVPRVCSILWDIVFYTICTEVRQTKARSQLKADFFFFPGQSFYVCNVSQVQLYTSLWTVTRLLCPWNLPGKNTRMGCHCPSPGNPPNPGIKPRSPALQVDSLPFEHLGMQCLDHENGNFSASISSCKTWKAWKFLLDLIF